MFSSASICDFCGQHLLVHLTADTASYYSVRVAEAACIPDGMKGVVVNTVIEEPLHRLKVITRAIGIMALAFSLAACAGQQHAPASRTLEHKSKPHVRVVDLEKKIHALINRERQQHGLNPLAMDHALVVIARKHSRDMAKRNYFDHISPEGHDFSYRYRKEGSGGSLGGR